MNPPPNILWLFCEDVCPWFGCYGDRTVPTPHIDALAGSGALFKRCFSPAPVCSPARSGVITGCMPTTIGAHQHQSARNPDFPQPLPPGVRTLPEIFREAGYFTYNHGKDDYNFTYDRSKLYAGPIEDHGIYGLSGSGHWRDREPGQPFFGQITLWGGKNKKTPASLITEQDVAVPPYYPSIPEFRNHYVRHYNQIMVTDDEVGSILKDLASDGLLDNTFVFFFSDHGYCLLRHKQFLYDGGIHVPLIIRGPGIAPGTVREDLVSSIDVAATSLSLAGLEIPPWMESRDLFAPDYHRDFVISARDRCDFTIDRIRSVRTMRFKYIRNFMPDRPLMQPQYRDRTADYKAWFTLRDAGKLTPVQAQFVADKRPEEELYDVEADPHETMNLAENPAYLGALLSHRTILQRWIEESGDQGQFPERPESLLPMIRHWGARATDPLFVDARRHLNLPEPEHVALHEEVAAGQK